MRLACDFLPPVEGSRIDSAVLWCKRQHACGRLAGRPTPSPQLYCIRQQAAWIFFAHEAARILLSARLGVNVQVSRARAC